MNSVVLTSISMETTVSASFNVNMVTAYSRGPIATDYAAYIYNEENGCCYAGPSVSSDGRFI